jgi:hypothetical protein
LDDPMFRSAVFEQLGENKLEGAVTTDICGKKDSHAVRLDAEAVDSIRKARLNRKVATSIFFESNGGQARAEATVPEIRLAVAEPSLDIGNVETVLDALENACYFLTVDRNRYRFGLTANLNKLLADKRASIQQPRIDDRVRAEVQSVFSQGLPIDRIFFPTKSSQIPNRAALTIVVLPPENSDQDEAKTVQFVDSMTKQCGTSDRTFKSALIWCVPDSGRVLYDEARKLLAWEDLQEEAADLKLEEVQRKQLAENLGKSKRDLREAVWRTYKTVMLLGKDNSIRTIDLGLVHSSADASRRARGRFPSSSPAPCLSPREVLPALGRASRRRQNAVQEADQSAAAAAQDDLPHRGRAHRIRESNRGVPLHFPAYPRLRSGLPQGELVA